ncbi:hypothetical protein [Nostoc parmelioides]|uniref:hypothetical protein n=1 Tax=Nostoc parmelioides TaxID=1521621 RepID=UPI0016882410|nr:hypothetical protein [Nostoc parmelioides]
MSFFKKFQNFNQSSSPNEQLFNVVVIGCLLGLMIYATFDSGVRVTFADTAKFVIGAYIGTFIPPRNQTRKK